MMGLSPLFIMLFIVTGLIFRSFPQIDIYFSHLFYTPETSFYLGQTLWSNFISKGVDIATGILIAFYVLFLITTAIKKRLRLLGIPRKTIVYMAVVLLLGPGLVVNELLKNNIGRARPVNTMCFDGTQMFTPAFTFSAECDRNCSFVSGHASFGYYWVTLGFLAKTPLWRRRGFWFGAVMGTGIGLVRIVQGRHFLSDVIFAFFFVYAVAAIVHWFMYSGERDRSSASDGSGQTPSEK